MKSERAKKVLAKMIYVALRLLTQNIFSIQLNFELQTNGKLIKKCERKAVNTVSLFAFIECLTSIDLASR